MCFSHWEKNGIRKRKKQINVRDIEGRSKNNKRMKEKKKKQPTPRNRNEFFNNIVVLFGLLSFFLRLSTAISIVANPFCLNLNWTLDKKKKVGVWWQVGRRRRRRRRGGAGARGVSTNGLEYNVYCGHKVGTSILFFSIFLFCTFLALCQQKTPLFVPATLFTFVNSFPPHKSREQKKVNCATTFNKQQ